MITQDDVIYFVMTDRFCNGDQTNDFKVDVDDPKGYHGGDFAGLTLKIPYLKALGVTAVWITPVYLSIGRYGDASGYAGYWALDFEKVDPHLYTDVPGRTEGSREYLKDLVTAFHDNGLKVILDMVVNHTGYHTDVYDKYPEKKVQDDWFNRDGKGDVKGELAGLPDLNHDLPKVADYFVNNILSWIEDTGIDGIRMDTARHVEDAFWYFFKSYVKSRHPTVTLIGEVLMEDPVAVGRYQRDNDFDTLFDFPLRKAMVDVLVHNGPMTQIARPRLSEEEPKGALDFDAKVYTNANRLVTLLDNHDLASRIMTEINNAVPGWDRMLASDIMKLCITFLLTTRGIPQIYYGTELAMEGGSDPDNRRDMPWKMLGEDGRPTEAHPFEREIFDHTKKMIGLRQEHEALRCGSLLTLYSDRFLYIYLREFQGDAVVVAINNGLEAMPWPMKLDLQANSKIPPRVLDLLRKGELQSQTTGVGSVKMDGTTTEVKLPRKKAAVFVVKKAAEMGMPQEVVGREEPAAVGG